MPSRRNLVISAAAAGLVTPLPAATAVRPRLYEMRRYQLRNGTQIARTSTYLEKALLPAALAGGSDASMVLSALIAPDSPFLLAITSHSSFEAYGGYLNKLRSDPVHQKGQEALTAGPDRPYERMEITLLEAFADFPSIEPPKGTSSHIFELRVYEAPNELALRKKVGMFASGEIAIFRKCGINPVFFATAATGSHLPNLTYLVSYESLAAREVAWSRFSQDPDWGKLRATPGLSDAEIVSNISSSLLRAVPFSAVR